MIRLELWIDNIFQDAVYCNKINDIRDKKEKLKFDYRVQIKKCKSWLICRQVEVNEQDHLIY